MKFYSMIVSIQFDSFKSGIIHVRIYLNMNLSED